MILVLSLIRQGDSITKLGLSAYR